MTDTRKYNVGLVQMRMGPDPEANFASAVRHIREAARLGANIVCLPELFRTQYFCQREDLALFDLAEAIPGPSTEKLGEVAREARVAIIASLFERRAPGLYHNTAVTLNADGSIASVYRKMHIPDDPLYYEKYYFAPGDLGFQAVDTAFGRVGTLVCWDQWYPEGARLTALQGAEVLFYPTAIGWHPAEKDEFGAAQYEAWQTIQRAHAIANGVYVAGVNRVGHGAWRHPRQSRRRGRGWSSGAGAFWLIRLGASIAKASHDAEEILLGEIDLALIEDTRRNWPFLRDRRIDAYAPITQRFLDPGEFVVSGRRAEIAMSDRLATATPQELGYRMPAEWEPHEATWLAWPHNPEDWPGKFQAIPWLYAEIVRLLAARERVHLLVDDAKAEQRARGILKRAWRDLERVSFHAWPTDRGWTRDSGPIFVRNRRGPGGASRIGGSMAGRSMTIGISTTRCRDA